MAVTAQMSMRELETEVQASLLELHIQVWKTRGHAKQRWLERALAEPVENSLDAERRASWIKQALEAVRSGRGELTHQAALLDAYTEHLNVLEMTLMAASEAKQGAEAKRAAEAKRVATAGSEVAKRTE